MRLLLDMNLSPNWVGFFRENGVEAVHWSTVGDPRASKRRCHHGVGPRRTAVKGFAPHIIRLLVYPGGGPQNVWLDK